MESFHWDNYFVTGLTEVDKQHFHLVEIINKFGYLLVNNNLSITDIELVFQELKEYTVYHFQEEESIMRRAGIVAHSYSQHVKVHEDFMNQVLLMNMEMVIDDPKSSHSLLQFLTHWLIYHILGMDQNMARQVEAIKNGDTPEQAFQNVNKSVDPATKALLNSLNHLFLQASENNKELHQLTKTLEVKVTQRTQALQEANQHLEKLAVTDVLTGLPNRRYAISILEELWISANKNNKPLSCLMIDADYLKIINDSYGHDAGDKVLVELSNKLQKTLRNDDIVCRLGGDEFLVVCENTDFTGANHIAQLLCNAVAELKVQVGSGVWLGSVSIGFASKQDQISDINELIKQADQGVYLAKKDGKNCVRSITSII
jgi:hemerythrin